VGGERVAEPPAFYARRGGRLADCWTLLHPPYTLWHLSYVAIGGALVPHMRWNVLGWTVLAFLLAMGIGAHALDELHGRPLGTHIPAGVLVLLAVVSVAAAGAIGLVVAAERTWWLAAFVAVGAFLVVAYNLELFRGAFHSDVWFAVAWGSFPLLAAYLAVAERITVEALVAAVFAGFLLCWHYADRTMARRNMNTSTKYTTGLTIVVLGKYCGDRSKKKQCTNYTSDYEQQ